MLRKCLTTAEVVQRLGISYGRVYRLLRTGELRGFRIQTRGAEKHGHWRIRPEELERYMEGGERDEQTR